MPTADYEFQRLVTGSMQWRMGMVGTGSSVGLSEGRVNENGLSPLGIELVDSRTLRIFSLSATPLDQTFSNIDFGAALDWRLDWTSDPDGVNGLASLWFKDSSGIVHNVYANRAFESDVVPDTVWCDTSDNTSVSNYIFLDSLTIMAASFPSLPGDFDQNGVVDAADHIVWRHGGAGLYAERLHDLASQLRSNRVQLGIWLQPRIGCCSRGILAGTTAFGRIY